MLKNLKNQISPNDEEKFYEDLDKRNSRQSCCTCQTLVIFFIILFLILAGLAIFIYYKVTHGQSINMNETQIISSSQLTDKFKNISPDVNHQIQITITSQELTTLLAEGLSAGNSTA